MNKISCDLIKFKIVQSAGYRTTATYTDDFVLYRGDDFIEIIIDEKYLNKKVKILLDNDAIFNGILKDTSIFIPVKEQIDLEELAKHISILLEI